MTRNLSFALIVLIVVIATVYAQARECSVSKTFVLVKAQVLSGSFADPTGAVLSGIQLQLLSEKKIVRDLRTDNLGRYDFGEIAPGKYKIKVEYGGKAFCAPKVRCKAGECRISPTLEPYPKNYVVVE